MWWCGVMWCYAVCREDIYDTVHAMRWCETHMLECAQHARMCTRPNPSTHRHICVQRRSMHMFKHRRSTYTRRSSRRGDARRDAAEGCSSTHPSTSARNHVDVPVSRTRCIQIIHMQQQYMTNRMATSHDCFRTGVCTTTKRVHVCVCEHAHAYVCHCHALSARST